MLDTDTGCQILDTDNGTLFHKSYDTRCQIPDKMGKADLVFISFNQSIPARPVSPWLRAGIPKASFGHTMEDNPPTTSPQ